MAKCDGNWLVKYDCALGLQERLKELGMLVSFNPHKRIQMGRYLKPSNL